MNLGNKANNPNTSQKSFWKIINRVMNKCRAPNIPPLLVNNLFILNCRENARYFNDGSDEGSDGISGQMLLLCDESVINFYKYFVNIDIDNVTPIFKKGDKQLIKNYRPISLLPICGKILEKIIFNNLYAYLHRNNRVFVQAILQPTNYYIFLMKSIRPLIVRNPLKLEQYFLTFLKPLTRCGMMD